MREEKNETGFQPDAEQENLIYRNNRELFYSFDPEKGYSRSVGYQYSANQEIIRQSWDAAEERLEEVRRKVMSGELSPIAFHMERCLMEIPMLAAYMQIAKWRVRRHLKPTVYNRLSEKTKNRYASVFGIGSGELEKLDITKPS